MATTEQMNVPESSTAHTISPLAENTSIAQEKSFIQEVAITKTEKLNRHGPMGGLDSSPSKRLKPGPIADLEPEGLKSSIEGGRTPTKTERQKGVAPIKAESVFPSSLGACYIDCHEGFSCAHVTVGVGQVLQLRMV